MKYGYSYDSNKNRNKAKIRYIIIFIVIAIVVTSFIFKNSNNNIVKTTSNVIISPFNFVYNIFSNSNSSISNFFISKKNQNNKIDELNNKIKEQEYSLLEKQKLIEENESLKRMLKISDKFQNFSMKFAKIITRSHDNWSQSFVINVGSNNGIKTNQAVVHEEGLVGYISKVNDTTSVVTTILDPIASVSVNIATLNEPAVLKGDYTLKSNNKLKLEYIPIGAEISIGDLLYTTGLGEHYPNGVPVGKVNEVVNQKNDIDRYAIVDPNVKIRQISEVGIIM